MAEVDKCIVFLTQQFAESVRERVSSQKEHQTTICTFVHGSLREVPKMFKVIGHVGT